MLSRNIYNCEEPSLPVGYYYYYYYFLLLLNFVSHSGTSSLPYKSGSSSVQQWKHGSWMCEGWYLEQKPQSGKEIHFSSHRAAQLSKWLNVVGLIYSSFSKFGRIFVPKCIMPSFGHLKLKDALIWGEMCAFRTSASDLFTLILYPDSCPYCSISTNNIGIELSGSETYDSDYILWVCVKHLMFHFMNLGPNPIFSSTINQKDTRLDVFSASNISAIQGRCWKGLCGIILSSLWILSCKMAS